MKFNWKFLFYFIFSCLWNNEELKLCGEKTYKMRENYNSLQNKCLPLIKREERKS